MYTKQYCSNAEYIKKKYNDNFSRDEKNDNFKTILCKNITSFGKCAYCDKCLYAHNLDEQKVEPLRNRAYKMIKGTENLSNIDLTKDQPIYDCLLSLTKLCHYCDEKTCTGGYNCKHGACDAIYVICHTDLTKGTCDGKCGKKHLSKKGLIPYCIKVVKNLKTIVNIPQATIINDDFFKRLEENINNVKPIGDLEWADIDDDNYLPTKISSNESIHENQISSNEIVSQNLLYKESNNKLNDNKEQDLFIDDNDDDDNNFVIPFNSFTLIQNNLIDKLKTSIFNIDITCL